MIAEILDECKGINREDLQFFTENAIYEIKNGKFDATSEFKKYLESKNYFGFIENPNL